MSGEGGKPKTPLPGTYLKRDEYMKLPGLIKYKPVARYMFSAGQAQSRFLHGLKEGKILGVLCPSCRRVYVPPRAYCEYCHTPTSEWVELPGTGTIHTAVVSYIATDRSRLEEPEIVGVIRLDAPGYKEDQYEFAGLFHKICGVTPEQVMDGSAIGMRVKPRWKPAEERTGSVTDIECFEPVEG
ncbi:MAG: Zn-ribbon domain-containing OB-fold protein [Desulfurococcales archaeon]|nr:Zn-ribbon domain-containing OB-fold protein [Desulfurococcales archaeon]